MKTEIKELSESGYNERKLSVLEAVENLGETGAMEVAEYIGISYDNARQTLSRYHFQGLLNRRKGVYSINENGLARLVYLQENIS